MPNAIASTETDILYCSSHPISAADKSRGASYLRISFEEAKSILLRHTVVKKDKDINLLHRTVENEDAYASLLKETYALQSIGMHLVPWPCGKALIRAIEEKTEVVTLLENKRILNLCSGGGLAEIYIAKNLKPELVVASDHDLFSCAMTHLNAELNEIEIGNNFIVSKSMRPDLTFHSKQGMVRLYDTVLAADFRYGIGSSQSQEALSMDVLHHLQAAHHNGADVIISDVDYASLYASNNPNLAAYHKKACSYDNLSADKSANYYNMDFDERSIELGMEPRHALSDNGKLPVMIHHWPAQNIKRTFARHGRSTESPVPPLLKDRWWQKAGYAASWAEAH